MIVIDKVSSVLTFFIAVFICAGVGILSSILSLQGKSDWFDLLKKPTWNPPAYLFGPVWTLLYFLMGITLWLIWEKDTEKIKRRNALVVFSASLFLNFLWSLLFFRFQSPALAFADIVLLLLSIILTMLAFSKISRLATWLLVPYILWVSFATVLNFSIWQLNF